MGFMYERTGPEEVDADELDNAVEAEALIEEVSIDGMCGVY